MIGSIYLDFARAFDSINHKRLIEKLTDMGVPNELVTLIRSYLANRVIRTKFNHSVSSPRKLHCGVPQGSILGPTLFLCYVNDLVSLTRNLGVSISLYADDAVIYCSNFDYFFVKMRLENSLQAISDWCT